MTHKVLIKFHHVILGFTSKEQKIGEICVRTGGKSYNKNSNLFFVYCKYLFLFSSFYSFHTIIVRKNKCFRIIGFYSEIVDYILRKSFFTEQNIQGLFIFMYFYSHNNRSASIRVFLQFFEQLQSLALPANMLTSV